MYQAINIEQDMTLEIQVPVPHSVHILHVSQKLMTSRKGSMNARCTKVESVD